MRTSGIEPSSVFLNQITLKLDLYDKSNLQIY